MQSIGIRDLKDSLSKTLAKVASGERVVITSHGKPVAELVPPSESSAERHYHWLVATGTIKPAASSHKELDFDPVPANGPRTATEVLMEERAVEE